MSKVKYVGWVGRDNWIGFALKKGEPLSALTSTEMAAITDYGFKFLGVEYKASENSQFCKKTDDKATIEFQLGGMIDIVASDSKCELIIYDAAHPNGIIWGDYFQLKMKQDS